MMLRSIPIDRVASDGSSGGAHLESQPAQSLRGGETDVEASGHRRRADDAIRSVRDGRVLQAPADDRRSFDRPGNGRKEAGIRLVHRLPGFQPPVGTSDERYAAGKRGGPGSDQSAAVRAGIHAADHRHSGAGDVSRPGDSGSIAGHSTPGKREVFEHGGRRWAIPPASEPGNPDREGLWGVAMWRSIDPAATVTRST